jgi:hypothetical protein
MSDLLCDISHVRPATIRAQAVSNSRRETLNLCDVLARWDAGGGRIMLEPRPKPAKQPQSEAGGHPAASLTAADQTVATVTTPPLTVWTRQALSPPRRVIRPPGPGQSSTEIMHMVDRRASFPQRLG